MRELENTIERAVVLASGPVIAAAAISIGEAPVGAAARGLPSARLHENVEWAERESVERALRQAQGVKKDAAEVLGISQRALSYYLGKIQDRVAGNPENGRATFEDRTSLAVRASGRSPWRAAQTRVARLRIAPEENAARDHVRLEAQIQIERRGSNFQDLNAPSSCASGRRGGRVVARDTRLLRWYDVT